MIAVERQDQTQERTTGNPLQAVRGGRAYVRCPWCGTEGEAARWELKRSPYNQPHTTPVYRCRGDKCGHVFAINTSSCE